MQEFNSNSFTWKNGRGWASLESTGLKDFPRDGFVMRSHRSGESRTFHYDHGTNEANEFFDGEGMAFVSSCGRCKVQFWH